MKKVNKSYHINWAYPKLRSKHAIKVYSTTNKEGKRTIVRVEYPKYQTKS